MTWKHWAGILVGLAILAFSIGSCSALAQEYRLFSAPEGETADMTIMEAFVALQPPSRQAFGEGLILRWEGRTAFHAARNGPIRNEICGQPLGCVEWVGEVCVIHYETELPPVVMDALLPRLIADCGLTQ